MMKTLRVLYSSGLLCAAIFILASCSSGSMMGPSDSTPARSTMRGDSNASIATNSGGTCAAIEIKPVGDEPFVERTLAIRVLSPVVYGYKVVGPRTERFVAVPVDVNGRPIVPASPSDGIVKLTALSPNSLSIVPLGKNEFDLTAIAHPMRGATNLVPMAPECKNVAIALLRNPIPITLSSSVYVSDFGSVSPFVPPATRVYDYAGTLLPLPSGAFSEVPFEIFSFAYDPNLGRLYIPTGDAYQLGPGMTVYGLNGNLITTSGFPNNDEDTADAFDTTNKRIFVGNVGTDAPAAPDVTVYTESGSLVQTISSTATSNGPFGMTYDTHLHRVYVRTANATVFALNDSGAFVSTPGKFPEAGGRGIGFNPFDDFIYTPSTATSVMGIYNEAGDRLATRTGTFGGLQVPTSIAFDTYTDAIYVANCPREAPSKSSASGFMRAFNEAGFSESLASGAFPKLICPTAMTIVPP